MTGATIEAAGEAVDGLLLGHALASVAGEAHAGDGVGSCLNCGTPLAGPYCHECGQSAHVHRTIASVLHDLAHGAFHFEGSIWRTLPLLAFRPGQLTRRYIAGERARFVSPLAAFLFGLFVMFAAWEGLGAPLHPHVQRDGRDLTLGEFHAEVAAEQRRIAGLETTRRALVATHASTAAIDGQIAGARADLGGDVAAERLAQGVADPSSLARTPIRTGWSRLDERIAAARANPSLLLFQLQANIHRFAWLLIPISAPFVWLMFAWRRRWRMYDHVVFVTYSLAAAELLLVLMTLAGAVGLAADWALALMPAHWFVQLRGAYRLGWWGALWRTAGLLVAASLSLALFAVLMIGVGLAG